jgi:trk system potassium uptake protein TrkA
MRAKFKSKCLICCVQRDDVVTIPDGNFVLQSGDKIGITATPAQIQEFLTDIGYIQKRIKSVMILGGSKTAIYLAKMLEASGVSVKIIEQNIEICHQLSEELPRSVIIHGDGAHQELLDEEGIDSTDAFITLTGMDEENILISYYAVQRGVPKIITKVSKDELLSTAEKLGLDSVITPKKIVSDVIVRYARAIENTKGSNVETLYKLMDDNCEAIEFKVKSGSKVVGIPFKYMKMKPMTLIAGILRGNQAITPSGDDQISLEDRVIIISSGQHFSDLDDILR